jgi:hypothetical protein
MPSVNEFLRVAAAELGTTENPPDSNRVKYSTWYGLIGPWCAMYVDWCWVRTGGQDLRQLLTPDWAYTPAGVNAFKRKGWWYPSSAAQPGDVIFFDFRPGGDSVEHVGIVESVSADKQTFTCLEGNTSGTNWANGGAVMRRNRGASLVVGVGRLPMTPSQTTPSQPAQEDKEMFLMKSKDRPEVWLTDLLTRTWMTSPQHLASTQFILAAAGKPSNVSVVEQSLIDSIPRNIPDADWLRFIDATATSVLRKINEAGVGSSGSGPSADLIAKSVADEVSRRMMG